MKAIFFNADHTLYNMEETPIYDSVYMFLAERLHRSKEDIKVLHHMLLDDVNKSTNPNDHRDEYNFSRLLKRLDAIGLYNGMMSVYNVATTKCMQGEPELENTLSRLRGEYRLFVVSNEFRDRLKLKLNHLLLDWRQYFEELVTPGDVFTMKPSKKYFEYAMEKFGLNVNEVTVVSSDWEGDLKLAKELGMKTVFVGKELEGDADHHAKTLKDVPGLLI